MNKPKPKTKPFEAFNSFPPYCFHDPYKENKTNKEKKVFYELYTKNKKVVANLKYTYYLINNVIARDSFNLYPLLSKLTRSMKKRLQELLPNFDTTKNPVLNYVANNICADEVLIAPYISDLKKDNKFCFKTEIPGLVIFPFLYIKRNDKILGSYGWKGGLKKGDYCLAFTCCYKNSSLNKFHLDYKFDFDKDFDNYRLLHIIYESFEFKNYISNLRRTK